MMQTESHDLPVHAFHSNLPPQHFDDSGVPFVTKYAHQKARKLVEAVMSITLTESLFEVQETEGMEIGTFDVDVDEVVEDDDEDENPHEIKQADTVAALIRKCARLQSQFSTVENLKYSGSITTMELCEMILHLLRLLTCSISYNPVQLHYEEVGYIFKFSEPDAPHESEKMTVCLEDLQKDLQSPFALPSPARESILAVLINILSNKAPLRAVSNSSIYTDDVQKDERFLLILHWKTLLRMLLRTAPYLDEHSAAKLAVDSSSRQATVLKRSVQLIRSSRHYFDQGLTPGNVIDETAKAIWEMVQTDALFHSHTHACYRASIILYLFHPSKCSPSHYSNVLPLWWECWTNIDRCPEFDFLWLSMFCRARKYDNTFDWTRIRQRLLTNAQYWLQLPIGGTAMDKSFPRVSNPRSRSCPPRLKVFVGASSSYEEGIDFVAKVAKLLVAGLGTGGMSKEDSNISVGARDVLRFLNFVTPYFNPSNLGSWTFTLGAFLHYLCYELCARTGAAIGLKCLAERYPDVAQTFVSLQPGVTKPIPDSEVVQLLHVLLPLCQQAMYSKNGHVGRAGEAAMLYLVQLDPKHTTAAFVDFAIRALDVGAVNLSHQAPSALSALTRLVHPSLKSGALLVRLPSILSLSLAGIDSNDQNKTLRTLIFYRSLTSWVPVGGKPEQWPTMQRDTEICGTGTYRLGQDLYKKLEEARLAPKYLAGICNLDETSLLKVSPENTQDDISELITAEAMSAMSDWALEFLERVFGLLRASGEREKTAKTTSGVASRHSSADVHAARNFSRVLKETLMQLFAAMDDEVHAMAIRSVCKFLQEESHPAAAKDSSLLCQAACAARKKGDAVSSPGLDSLILVLTDDLTHHSVKTLVYRLRCLAGAVRLSGPGVYAHRGAISDAINFALASTDRHLFKTGCKLLRHTLSTLSESYPISSDCRPRAFVESDSVAALGRSAQLTKDPVEWYVPDQNCVEFAHHLFSVHVVARLDALCAHPAETNGNETRSRFLNSLDVNELRRCLRVVRYSIRGGASYLLDGEYADIDMEDIVPYEMACHRLLAVAPDEIRETFVSLRGRLASFLVVLSAVVASDTLYPDSVADLPENEVYKKTLPLISADPKVCKECCLMALLLLTRRGASFRSQEARTIWKAQKQLATDYSLSAQVEQIGKALQQSSLYSNGTGVFYKDGEDAGKTLPRRLLVGRVQLFHDALQRNASFEVPRRLRRKNMNDPEPRKVLFDSKGSLPELLSYLEQLLSSSGIRSLDTYEGICDGLCSLCCHSNTQVRASAIGVIDYAMTRFAWLVSSRVPRLLSAISLTDNRMNGKFGFPSCALLVDKLNKQGKRKRLAEAIKGVCSILSLTRSLKQLLASETMRFRLSQTLCGTDRLVFLLPAEEVQKAVHYLQVVFSPYRSKIYFLPRVAPADQRAYVDSLSFANDILAEKKVEATTGDNESVQVHWRKLLLGCWFLLTLIDEDGKDAATQKQYERAWETCFRILENESGQPLQRVALGLLGRLLSSSNKAPDRLHQKLATEAFCNVLGQALVFDHREDSSIGGGHDAQWSAGVEDIIRDASRNISLRTLFPFQRTSQSMGSFKSSHSQLVESVLEATNAKTAKQVCEWLLSSGKQMAGAPPNEEQRNQQITAAEIFAGVCSYFLKNTETVETMGIIWNELLLPHLEEVMNKIPFALSAAYFDALRYSLQFMAPKWFYVLTEWLVNKIISTLWQPKSDAGEPGNGSSQPAAGTDGFTVQSKWLYLFSAILIELDDSEFDGSLVKTTWYASQLARKAPLDVDEPKTDLKTSWTLIVEKLLPTLLAALGHPFDTCRDHVARCLFRICYCHRKRTRVSVSKSPSRSGSLEDLYDLGEKTRRTEDPGSLVVGKLLTLQNSDEWTFKDRHNALITARRFILYCVNLGEAKFEYSDYVIPLLPLAFEALRSTVEDETEDAVGTTEENAAKRALESEVVKVFRYAIAELSVTTVISYGRNVDIDRVLDVVDNVRNHEKWQIRHACANFLRCFQGAHKFLFSDAHATRTMAIVTSLLADERREVSSAAMALLTGILAASSETYVRGLVEKYAIIARKSKMKRPKKGAKTQPEAVDDATRQKEARRARNQQTSVFFLSAAVMSQPYETPKFVPVAIAAISTHSFERSAPLGVRETVKRCCAEYKRTHMSDNWELHRKAFTQEQLESLDDVVSSPHYYA